MFKIKYGQIITFCIGIFFAFLVYYMNSAPHINVKMYMYIKVKQNNNKHKLIVETNALRDVSGKMTMSFVLSAKNGKTIKTDNKLKPKYKNEEARWFYSLGKLKSGNYNVSIKVHIANYDRDCISNAAFSLPVYDEFFTKKICKFRFRNKEPSLLELLFIPFILLCWIILFNLIANRSRIIKDYSPKRLAALDSLRFIAILIVALFHAYGVRSFNFVQLVNIPLFDGGFYLGYLGVNLFFIISGFSLYYPVLKKKTQYVFKPVSFYGGRLSRIWPPYLVAIIFTFGFHFFMEQFFPHSFPEKLRNFNHILTHATFTHTFWKNTFYSINPSWWFLSVLIQFYLIFPIILYLYKKVKPYFAFIITVIISFAYRGILYIIFGDKAWAEITYKQIFISRLWEFSAGFLVAHYINAINSGKIVIKLKKSYFNLILLILSVASFLVFKMNFITKIFVINEAITVFFIIVVFWALVKDSYLSRFLKYPVFVYLGVISFSVYLMHQPIIIYLDKILPILGIGGVGRYVYLILLGVPLAFLFSMGFYYLVENKLAFMGNLFKRKS